MTPKKGNWKLLDPKSFKTQLKEIEGKEPASLLIPIPQEYGGDQIEKPLLDVKGDTFTIAKTKDEGIKQIEDTDKFASLNIKGDLEEDMKFYHMKEQEDNEHKNVIYKKQREEEELKEQKRIKGQKTFNDWNMDFISKCRNWKKENE